MEVEYELTADDLYAFQWRATQRSASVRRMRRKVYIWLFVAVLLVSIVPAIGRDGFVISRVSWFFLFTFFPLVAGLSWVFERRGTRSAIREFVEKEKPDKGQIGKHTLVLSDDGLTESTVVGEQRTSWVGIDRVEQDPDYIFIYTGPSAAHVVPKRAFAYAADAERFQEFARSHVLSDAQRG